MGRMEGAEGAKGAGMRGRRRRNVGRAKVPETTLPQSTHRWVARSFCLSDSFLPKRGGDGRLGSRFTSMASTAFSR